MIDFAKLRAAFEAKYIPEPNSGCWLWTAAVDRRNYGKIGFAGRFRTATHVAWFLERGEWPAPGINACHKCDNPLCVNPDHLFLGTQADNIRDMRRKGRGAVGERTNSNALTAAQVRGILFLHSLGRKGYVMARQYGVSKMTISRIVNRQLWRHIDV